MHRFLRSALSLNLLPAGMSSHRKVKKVISGNPIFRAKGYTILHNVSCLDRAAVITRH